MPDRHYDREELQVILARALERQARAAGRDDLSHEQLLETAREVGLSPAEIDAAIADVDSARSQRAVVTALQAQQRQRLRSHAAAYLAVNLGLWGIDWATAAMGVNPQSGWHWIVAAAWGIGLLLHAWRTLTAGPAELAQKAARWQARQARRRQKQAMQRAIEGAVTGAVTTGADALTRLLEQRKRPDDERKR